MASAKKGIKMPLYDYQCKDCGCTCEVLVIGKKESPVCTICKSTKMTKLMSAHSSISGNAQNTAPGPGDTACCGSSPGKADGCAGPGTCCGKVF